MKGLDFKNRKKTDLAQAGRRARHSSTSNVSGPNSNRSLQNYLVEIEAFNLLSREEERDLALKYRNEGDEEAYCRLVSSNLRLVVKIAMSYQGRGPSKLLDLIQEGNLGLLKAAGKFDPDRGARFSYYASFWIRAYIMRFMMANLKLVKIGTTQDQRRLFYNLHKERKSISSQGHIPEHSVLAKRLGVNEESLSEMECRLGSSEVPLDSLSTHESVHPFTEEVDAHSLLSEGQTMKMIRMKLKDFRTGLCEKRAFIFDHRIMADDPLTLCEIGEKYAISKERVRQLEKSIVGRLGKWLASEAPEIESNYPG